MTVMSRTAKVAIGTLALLWVLTGCTFPPPAEGARETTPAAAAAQPVDVPGFDLVNLNDMTSQQLRATIPDFGLRMVREFFEYQPYVSISQFRREIGKYVDAEQVAFYEQYVFVPVDFNESDLETVKQIPGIDDAEAAALLESRPYDSREAFLAKIAQYVTPEQLDRTRHYLTD